MTVQLLGSSPDLSMMKKLIAEYWYNTPDKIILKDNGDNTFLVYQSKLMVNYRVNFKNGRYRFEHRFE
jgi:hypothetical protein